jgi:hypothetical protein
MADELRIQGVSDQAEVLDGDIQSRKCSCCGFDLQMTGGIAVSDGFKVIASDATEYDCPICKAKIPLVEKVDAPST